MYKKINLFLVAIIFLIISLNLVDAVGISKYYYTGEPLRINSGESKEVPIALFMASNEKIDRKLSIEMIHDAGIASLVHSEIKVPADSINREIKLKFKIDKEIQEGTEYIIDLRVKDETSSTESGMIGFNSVKMVSFPILVTASEKNNSSLLIWILFIVIILLIIVIFFWIWKIKKNRSIKSK